MKLVVDTILTYEDHVRMSEIEKRYFKSEYWTSPDVSWNLYCKNKEIYLCVRDADNGRIAGHICVLPITDGLFGKIISGTFIDADVDVETVLEYGAPGKYKLHFFVIAVADEYKAANIHPLLFRALKKKILELRERGVVFTDVTAECVTKAGVVLCETILNMKCIKHTRHDSRIYWADGLFNSSFPKMPSFESAMAVTARDAVVPMMRALTGMK